MNVVTLASAWSPLTTTWSMLATTGYCLAAATLAWVSVQDAVVVVHVAVAGGAAGDAAQRGQIALLHGDIEVLDRRTDLLLLGLLRIGVPGQQQVPRIATAASAAITRMSAITQPQLRLRLCGGGGGGGTSPRGGIICGETALLDDRFGGRRDDLGGRVGGGLDELRRRRVHPGRRGEPPLGGHLLGRRTRVDRAGLLDRHHLGGMLLDHRRWRVVDDRGRSGGRVVFGLRRLRLACGLLRAAVVRFVRRLRGGRFITLVGP